MTEQQAQGGGQSALLDLLKSTPVMQLPTLKDQHLIEFGKEDLIRDVHEVLSKRNILSAPVYDITTDSYLGMIDQRDVVDFSGMNSFNPLKSTANVHEVIEEMINKGLHRIPLLDGRRVVAIVTQTDIVRWIYTQKDVLGAFASKTIGELEKDIGGIGGLKQLLLYITEDDPVVKAFEIMQKYNIHGVPVLSKDGQIIGNISASDMKVNPDHSPVIKCTTSSTFLEMLTQLVEKKVHRTYVVDAEGKPVDIITLTNILHAIDLFATKKPSN